MALWPNGRYMTRSTYKGLGVAPGGDAYIKGLGDRMNRFVGEALTKTASTPDGYGMKGYVPPLKAGSMSTLTKIADVVGSGNALAGGPMIGTGDVATFTSDAGLSMVVSMSANTAMVTFSASGIVLALTIGLSGTAEWTLTGTSGLSMIVPFDGTGTVASLTGTSDLRGILSMSGEWTPFTELSPEGLANAVWNGLATQYNNAGTMGAKLNTASSGGVDLNALAEAVWEYVDRTLTAGGSSGATPEDIAAAILAAAQLAPIHADIQKVNAIEVKGTGTTENPWTPVG